MMNKDILLVAEVVSNEKGVSQSIIFEAIESALAMAAKKASGEEIDTRVQIDRLTGDYVTFRRWRIVTDEEYTDDLVEVIIEDEQEKRPDEALVLGEYVETEIDNAEFGRISAQNAKQVIVQKMREAERNKTVQEYQSRVGELISGQVKRIDRSGDVIIDLGDYVEAVIQKKDMINRDHLRTGDRVRGYIREVSHQQRGPQIFLSRTVPEFLIELFRIEVPEIGQGMIEIKGAARDPGQRAKIAVKSHDVRVDPIGACVGMRGSRVQTVMDELEGERIDIILFDDDTANYAIKAMAPAEVKSIVVNEARNSMDIAVDEDNLSKAIGRGGQNIRLASQLLGWELNVMTEEAAKQKATQENTQYIEMFNEALDVEEDISSILVREGFISVEQLAYVPLSELEEIDEFDDEIAEAIQERANSAILTKRLARQTSDKKPDEDLLTMEGMDEDLAYLLAENDIISMEDLAELGVDEVVETTRIDPRRASDLIMTARAPWFEEEQG
jgi:N utilization substance protein A